MLRSTTLTALLIVVGLSRLHASAAPQPQHSTLAAQQTGERDVKHFNLDKQKLAIEGYDPVAYFPEGGGKPLKGSDKISVAHKGVVYRFANEANKALFLKTPEKFEPQYGGWCAYAMALGEKVEIDPKSFKITEGKLYLFYKSFFNDTREKWLKEEAALATRASANWKSILEKPAPKQSDASDVAFVATEA
jgi:YHS domain-containing protein